MTRLLTKFVPLTAMLVACLLLSSRATIGAIADFEGLGYASGLNYENGEHLSGSFQSNGITFSNSYNIDFQSWNKFAYSKVTDTALTGFANQYSAVPGSGAGGSQNYAVGNGYVNIDPVPLFNIQPFAFDPNNASHLNMLPNFTLPVGQRINSVAITNSTYTASIIQIGNQFAKKFGGDSGNDPDWYKVTAYGTDANGVPLGVGVELYLADYRFSNNAQDYMVSDWLTWDLSALANARTIYFNPSSSDVGDFGMNTPGYYALDNIQISAVPEPATYAGWLLVAGGVLHWKRRQRQVA